MAWHDYINKTKISIKSKKYYQNSWSFVIDNDCIPKLCFNETLAVVNEKNEELGEFIGKIWTGKLNNTSIIISLNSTNTSEYGEETGMCVGTTTTENFHSYEEKWSQWYNVS